jgi:ABC-type antimicrobial peptide transport system permease subunit
MDHASPLARFWSEFRESTVAVAALAVVVLIVLLAVIAPLIAPQDPYDLSQLVLSDARRPPGYVHMTDGNGIETAGINCRRHVRAAIPRWTS